MTLTIPRARLTYRRCRYFAPFEPSPKQHAFLTLTAEEAFYGGAARGGKSAALLMAALQYVDVPGYAALIIRRTYQDLSQPGALIPVSHAWLGQSDARWDAGANQWQFPSGASLKFGHLGNAQAHEDYRGGEYQFIGFDEVSRLPERQYEFLFSRLTSPEPTPGHAFAPAPDGLTLPDVPLRIRATSNPGGPGHEWVRRRFIAPETRKANVRFMPAQLYDNPGVDHAAYERSLGHLGATERARLLHGDWSVREPGEMFHPYEWLADKAIAEAPPGRRIRAWDQAAAEDTGENDPDWTAGAKMSFDRKSGLYTIEHVERFRRTPGAVEASIRATADSDGADTVVGIEQLPGVAGKLWSRERWSRTVLQGFTVQMLQPIGAPAGSGIDAKVFRAEPFATAMENGLIRYVPGDWVNDFFDELDGFPSGDHDDQVDAAAYAFNWLRRRVATSTSSATSAADVLL